MSWEMRGLPGYTGLPDVFSRPGTMTLRSDHHNYSRTIKSGNWHQNREAEPKDYDMNKNDKRDLRRSTYERMATITKGEIPETTYQEHSKQILTGYSKENGRSIITHDNFKVVDGVHETGSRPFYENRHNTVLPKHSEDFNKGIFDTTQQTDYRYFFPIIEKDNKNNSKPTCSNLDEDRLISDTNKRCQSQFTDTDDYRRWGRNTFMDESGVYANTHLRRLLPVYQVTNTIPERLT